MSDIERGDEQVGFSICSKLRNDMNIVIAGDLKWNKSCKASWGFLSSSIMHYFVHFGIFLGSDGRR